MEEGGGQKQQQNRRKGKGSDRLNDMHGLLRMRRWMKMTAFEGRTQTFVALRKAAENTFNPLAPSPIVALILSQAPTVNNLQIQLVELLGFGRVRVCFGDSWRCQDRS